MLSFSPLSLPLSPPSHYGLLGLVVGIESGVKYGRQNVLEYGKNPVKYSVIISRFACALPTFVVVCIFLRRLG